MAAPLQPLDAHSTLVFLLQLSVLLFLAFVLGSAAGRAGLPTIAGELAAGVIAGPSVLGHVAPGLSHWLFPAGGGQGHLLDAVGQVGVLLLVGLTGVHIDLGLIRRRAGATGWIGTSALLAPLALGVGAGVLLPGFLIPGGADRATFALFLGVALGVSALPVIAKTLLELGLMHRDVGQLTLGAVMVDDIAGWLLLSIVAAMAASDVHAGAIALSIASIALVLFVAVAVRPVLRPVLRAMGTRPDGRMTMTFVVVLVLGSAAATQAMRLEAVVGAFAAGILISSCRTLNRQHLGALQTSVMSVLAPIFFATAGLRMDLTGLADLGVLAAAAVILALAIAGKFAGAYFGARLSHVGRWESLTIGAGVNARGVVEVIIAMVGLRLGILGPEVYTIIVLMAIVTSLMAPPVLRWAMRHVVTTAEEQLREERFAIN